MFEPETGFSRRLAIAGLLGSVLLPSAARAAGLGSALTGVLGRASDGALDKLARPGAFYDDPAIRIALPLLGGGIGGAIGSVLDFGQKLGVTDNLVRRINNAAGSAAGEAKPIFRSAISSLSLSDVPGIATQKDGATRYLERSAGDQLEGKLRPLVDDGLEKAGAYRKLDKMTRRYDFMAKAGLTHDKLGHSVTQQALKGIFHYIGSEEARLRDNPLDSAGGLFKGLLGN